MPAPSLPYGLPQGQSVEPTNHLSPNRHEEVFIAIGWASVLTPGETLSPSRLPKGCALLTIPAAAGLPVVNCHGATWQPGPARRVPLRFAKWLHPISRSVLETDYGSANICGWPIATLRSFRASELPYLHVKLERWQGSGSMGRDLSCARRPQRFTSWK